MLRLKDVYRRYAKQREAFLHRNPLNHGVNASAANNLLTNLPRRAGKSEARANFCFGSES